MSNAKRDDNRVPSLLAVSDVDGTTVVPLQADAVTKRLKVAAVISGGGGTPGGSDTQVQFNDAGTFGGDAGLTYNKTTDVLTAGNIIDSGLTASSAVATDGSKQLVSVTNTGTGNNVLATSPTLVTPALGTPSSGTLTSCTGLPISTGVSGLGTGVATFLATPSSANLASALTTKTGTGDNVFATSPTLVTPLLGTPTSGTLTNCTGLPVSTGISGLGANVGTFLATPSSANLAAAVTDETGSGALVFATSPTLTTPKIVTSINDTNGNEIVAITATGSAVNEVTIANAATGGNPKISATGGDTDIGLDLQSKGADPIRLNQAGGDIEVGGAATASSLKFMEPSGSGTNFTAFKAQAQAGNVTYTLPAADGSSNQVLSTNGSGTLSWATAGSPADYSCRIHQTGTTSITTSWVAIAFAAEDFDTDTMHDNVTNNTRITFTHAGKYCVGGSWQGATNAVVGIRIRLNGTTILASQKQGNSSATEQSCVSTIYNFAANDYIELQGYSSTTQNTSGDSNTSGWAFKFA